MQSRSLVIVAILLGAVVGGIVTYGVVTSKKEPAHTETAAKTEAPKTLPAGHPAAGAPAGGGQEFDHFRVGSRNVKAMLADGPLMWIGTSAGVIRYEIASDAYKLFNNKSGLLSNGVFHLSKVGEEIWVGTYGGGLSILNQKTGLWRNYNVPEGMGDAFIYDAIKLKNGDVWIATWSGANRIAGGDLDKIENWELYTVDNTKGGLPNDWVYGLAEGKNGEVWMATEGGLARYKDGQWTNWKHADGLGAQYETVKAEIPFKNDPGQASQHHARQKKEMGLENVDIAYNPNYIVSLAVGPDGRVWCGTWGGGLSVFDGTSWKTLTMKDGLPANHVFMLRFSPKGELWAGTSQGLARYDGTGFKTYTSKDGIFADNVFSMAFSQDGSAWVGSFGGVARFRKGL